MPKYVFKAAPELAWSLIVSMSTVLLLALLQFDPTTITDWKTWAIGLGAGAVRAGAGATLDWIQKYRSTDPIDELVEELTKLSAEDRSRLIALLESSRS